MIEWETRLFVFAPALILQWHNQSATDRLFATTASRPHSTLHDQKDNCCLKLELTRTMLLLYHCSKLTCQYNAIISLHNWISHNLNNCRCVVVINRIMIVVSVILFEKIACIRLPSVKSRKVSPPDQDRYLDNFYRSMMVFGIDGCGRNCIAFICEFLFDYFAIFLRQSNIDSISDKLTKSQAIQSSGKDLIENVATNARATSSETIAKLNTTEKIVLTNWTNEERI